MVTIEKLGMPSDNKERTIAIKNKIVAHFPIPHTMNSYNIFLIISLNIVK